MANILENAGWAEWGVRNFARGSALIWAASWIAFGLISGVGEGFETGKIFMQTALPGLIFMITVLLAWKWQRLGAIILLLEGSILATYFLSDLDHISFLGLFFVLLTGTLPAFVLAFLFIVSNQMSSAGNRESTLVKSISQ